MRAHGHDLSDHPFRSEDSHPLGDPVTLSFIKDNRMDPGSGAASDHACGNRRDSKLVTQRQQFAESAVSQIEFNRALRYALQRFQSPA